MPSSSVQTLVTAELKLLSLEKCQETIITPGLFLTSALSDFRAWRKEARIESERILSRELKQQ
ncbi:hypothetical protein D9M71_778950 [compost metagenome]